MPHKINDRLQKLLGHQVRIWLRTDDEAYDYTGILKSISEDEIVLKYFHLFGSERTLTLNRRVCTLMSVEDLGKWKGKK